MQTDLIVRKELTRLIDGGNAHATFDQAIHQLPANLRSDKPTGIPYNIWQLVEHIRVVQWDILGFSTNPDHQSPEWPEGYWTKVESPTEKEWEKSIDQFKDDRKVFLDYLNNPDNDLYKPFEHGSGQNLMREAMLIAQHESYHTGEIIVIRRLFNNWKS